MDTRCSQERLLQLALSWGEAHLSSQTGLIHYWASAPPGERHEAVPLKENALYALALLRHRDEEGARLLEHLLAWQDLESGGFPAYLHESPRPRDPFIAEWLGPAFLEILRLYGGQLGDQLRRCLGESTRRLLAFGRRRTSFPEGPEGLAQQIVAYEHGLCEREPNWAALASSFHAPTASFVGDGEQWGGEPAVTLYDLLMGLRYGPLSLRAQRPAAAHLEALVVHRFLDKLPDAAEHEPLAMAFGPCPLFAVWGDLSRAHTLKMDAKGSFATTIRGKSAEVIVTLPPSLPELDKSSACEVALFFDRHSELMVTVSGAPATLFHLGETVKISSGAIRAELQVHLESGEGDFVGLILRGNRSGQRAARGLKRFELYDLQVSMRTIRRSSACSLSFSLNFH